MSAVEPGGGNNRPAPGTAPRPVDKISTPPYATILNSAGQGIVGLDRNGRATFVNRAASQMLDLNPQNVVGKLLHDVLHHTKPGGSVYPWQECPVLKTLQKGTACRTDHEVFWRSDQRSFPVEYTGTPIREAGEVVGAVVTFSDITERRLLERQLAQAQKLESIGQLAAGIAHEINTPTQYIGDNVRFLQDVFRDLNALLLKCSSLEQAADQGEITQQAATEVVAATRRADVAYLIEEIPRAIGQSLEGVERVAMIVRSMKQLAQPGSDQKQAVDLNRAIESTLTVSRNEWKYVAQAVTDLDPRLPPVSCLPAECNQVLLNLIINAAHAVAEKLGPSPAEKGTITVSTRRDGDWVEIRVEDTGTGIPEQFRSRVFDPFFTTKEVGRGTGQGLALAHSIVTEMHGGTISFETEVGRGTAFIIRLPMKGQ